MCGICGIYNYKTKSPVDRELLNSMTDTMVHRGPDDSGLYFEDSSGLGLGFRRLSIIDLSLAGHQPMSNEDGSIWIVFNGEIYNFLDLRPQLEAAGHIFRSLTDAEVILHQYEQRGIECVNDLQGMFGLAIWDRHNHRLALARDRVGKKPLFYFDDGERLVFASELKAILFDRSVPRHLDFDALAEYLSIGYVGSPKTILSGICKLPPGHLLTCEADQLQSRRYWDWLPSFVPDYSIPEEEWIEQLRVTLREVVNARMISDVPLGAFLSGGVDSSAVVATMASLSDRPVKTFSIGFEDLNFNELPYARQVAQRFNTEHHEFVVQPEAITDVLPKLVRQFDEPFADPSALPTYYLSKMAREHVTVCLSGDGGDETLAGYKRYNQAMSERKIDWIPDTLKRIVLSPIVKSVPFFMKGHRMARRLMLPQDERYISAMRLFHPELLNQLLSPELAHCVSNSDGSLHRFLRLANGLDLLSKIQYLDGMTYLPEDILVKLDRTSMLNSLEVRCPLLDHRFLELAARIPPTLRLKNGTGKYIFKKMLRGVIPDQIIDRSKMGFGIPGQSWLKGDVSGFVRETLSDRRISQRHLLCPDVIKVLLSRQGFSLRTLLWPQIWSLLVLELWCQAYLDE